MTHQTFHFFPALPPEIRRTIYILATPPRVVHIQEVSEDEKTFLAELKIAPFRRTLCPSLTHFALHWRKYIPKAIKQPTLEHFGVTGARPLNKPWTPSAATPEIPIPWLTEQPELAWEMVRNSYLYSKAPIPALLHTWSESREELIRFGYELAFRTRSNGPRTWFNFKRDVMYLTKSESRGRFSGTVSLSNNMFYEVGQFHPFDLTRVKRLALAYCGPLLFPWRAPSLWTEEIAQILPLFPGLSELLLAELEDEDVMRWSERGPHWNRNSGSSTRERWCCLAVEEIDALLSLLSDGFRTDLGSVGLVAEMFKEHQQRRESSDGYFEHRRVVTEQALADARDAMIASSHPIPMTPWSIPRIRAVHILPESMVPGMIQERRNAWNKFCELKRDWRKAIDGIPSDNFPQARAMTTKLGTMCSPLLPWLPDEDWDDVSDPVVFCIFSDEQMGGEALSRGQRRAKSWWVQKGTVKEPGLEIIA
ncbi:hypothetical protein P170DRAFT_466064 [Aspergillus steynii IBT 23096]|uniref:2EXR domain-containing protein n=1 Tax=Aspergillus steynii IBT 23096 TaxID=1392250 RepID=A0A2I2G153_9EURO|nr:uncharacterized protein P170DRAFT_466064 [Aspergillus steynii IBT 23096]PLB46610.1 hypothetical protein P170DRAFT_466064 [Aspergillus steynii IBT 23096]